MARDLFGDLHPVLLEESASTADEGRPLPAQPCMFCGEPELVEILEVWAPREFQLETCCEAMHEEACRYLAADPKEAAAWLRRLGLDEIVGMRSRRIIDDGLGQLQIDWMPEIVDIQQAQAFAFVEQHHRHCGAPAGWLFGAGLRNGSELIGVCCVGRPVARMIDPKKVVEVNRVCLREDVAEGLRWNGCSQFYGWAAREARKRRMKIITYTRADEPGTSLVGAGWVVEAKVKGRHWDSKSRPRARAVEKPIDKLRWTPRAMLGMPLR